MSKDDFNMRVITLMMSLDKHTDGPRKDMIMQSLSRSLTPKPKVPWYRRIFTRGRR